MPFDLNTREKLGILAAGVFIAVLVVYQFGVSPLLAQKKYLERQLASKQKILQEVVTLEAEYERISRRDRIARQLFDRRHKEFSLFTFLDRLAGKVDVKEHITYMKPSAERNATLDMEFSRVEMELKNIRTEQLVSYLHQVESAGKMVLVKRLAVSKNTRKDQGFIDVVLDFETVKT